MKNEWRRIEDGTGVRKVRGQASISTGRFRFPHEELAQLGEQFCEARKLEVKEGDQSVYVGEMTAEAAQRFIDAVVPPQADGTAGGTGRFWVGPAGDLSKWITLSDPGMTKVEVEVPEGALQVLADEVESHATRVPWKAFSS